MNDWWGGGRRGFLVNNVPNPWYDRWARVFARHRPGRVMGHRLALFIFYHSAFHPFSAMPIRSSVFHPFNAVEYLIWRNGHVVQLCFFLSLEVSAFGWSRKWVRNKKKCQKKEENTTVGTHHLGVGLFSVWYCLHCCTGQGPSYVRLGWPVTTGHSFRAESS